MTYRMRAHELATVIEARCELASALHDVWEGLLDLAEQTESLRVQFFRRHLEQEASLIERRLWLDPNLELIGKPGIG